MASKLIKNIIKDACEEDPEFSKDFRNALIQISQLESPKELHGSLEVFILIRFDFRQLLVVVVAVMMVVVFLGYLTFIRTRVHQNQSYFTNFEKLECLSLLITDKHLL